MAKKKSTYWSEDEAREILRRSDASGLGDREFARRQKLSPGRLWWWRKRLGEGSGKRRRRKPQAAPSFARVVPKSSGELGGMAQPVEVHLRNGRRLVLPTSVDVAVVQALANALEADPC